MQTVKKAYWWPAQNFGDTLTPIVLEHFLGGPIEWFDGQHDGRIVGIGSIAHRSRPGDIIWGTGSNRPGRDINAQGIQILATRGPLSEEQFKNTDHPGIYGDPAILLPLIYHPQIAKTADCGVLPHYVDKSIAQGYAEALGAKTIDIQADWKTVIEEVISCKRIISSSLHGIIVAEAYGIPATWVQFSDKIIGGSFKFHDYFLGTGRKAYGPGEELPPIPDLEARQNLLIEALQKIR